MKVDDKGDVRAFVQTAEQAGEYVWVINAGRLWCTKRQTLARFRRLRT